MPRAERPSMADYGVPADPEGLLAWSWAEERLVANRNYWVVTVSASGRPHALPVWGVWMANTERFWFSCGPSSRKARNVAENPHCCVTVDDTVECVSVEGTARVVDQSTERTPVDSVVAAYLAKYWEDEALHDEMEAFIRRHLMVEVTPDRAFGIIERDEEFSQRATRWMW